MLRTPIRIPAVGPQTTRLDMAPTVPMCTRSHSARWLVVLLMACAATAGAQGEPAVIAPEAAQRAADAAAEAWLGKGIAGFSVSILQDGRPLLDKSYGKASVELDVPTPTGAVYEIASDAKPFTAAAILRLAGRGKLTLEDPVSRHLPDALPAGVGDRITLRQLLSHTSGIPDFSNNPAFEALSTQRVPPEAVLALVRDDALLFEPGAAQAYSNTGYLLLAMVVGKVAGVPWGEFIEREFFAPLGMADSRDSIDREIVEDLAVPYELVDGTLVRAPYHAHELVHGNAGLRSSARDMATWANALHTGKVLPPALYREMHAPQVLPGGTALPYALGMVVSGQILGHASLFHGGTFPGYMSHSAYLPAHRLAIAVLTNTTGPYAEDAIAQDILLPLIGDRRTAPTPHPLELGEYVGEYVGRVASQRVMQVTVADGKLMAVVEPWDAAPRTFVAVAPDRFTSEFVDLRFTRKDGRIVGVVRSGQTLTVPFDRR